MRRDAAGRPYQRKPSPPRVPVDVSAQHRRGEGPTGGLLCAGRAPGGLRESQLLRRRVAASRPPPASISREPAAKGTSAPVAGGAITALPLAGVAAELVAEVPSTPPAGAGVLVGTLVGAGTGLEVATGMGVLVPVAVEVEEEVVVVVCVDLVVVWLDVTA